MLTRPLSLYPPHPALAPATPRLRRSAAALLHSASRSLQQLAHALAPAPAQPDAQTRTPPIEFHAEAGAPEGALYVDGQWVGRLQGVSRL